MKRITCLILLISSTLIFAQENTDSIQIISRVKEYANLIENKDFDQVLEYVSPKIFEVVEKETMLGIFEKTMNAEEFEIAFDSFDVKGISKPFLFDKDVYYDVETESIITMKVVDGKLEGNIGLLIAMMTQQYGDENVSYDKETKSITMKKESNMLAIQYQGDKTWYFITIDKGQKTLAKMVVPEGVIDHFSLFR
ncbi:hypothetical protein UJ101_02123 [Flavobacteriaceae bacterium UJ101]|nr:hypothetical protein UJ101_02123 [Flavobacteriaceae bacterium UJ101]